MTILQRKFEKTTIAKLSNSEDLRQLLIDPWLKSETIIIKPNWVSDELANFTNVEAMRILFEALDSHFVVTESHILLRRTKEGKSFIVGDKEVNWKWLLMGEGWKWLIENPSWEWFKNDGHWDQIKVEDQLFLDETGFTDLFKEFNVEYINVTDEVWSGRIADPKEIKKAVESRFKPIQSDTLYSMVPKKLYNLRGSTFISLAKMKMYGTFTMKNLFGMIPDPARPWWHGPNNSRFTASLIDINKIYHSLFNIYGICEALNIMSFQHPEGEYSLLLPRMRYNTVENLGIIAYGRDLVSLDAILLNLTKGLVLQVEDINCAPIEFAQEEFGAYNREILEESKIKTGHWLSQTKT